MVPPMSLEPGLKAELVHVVGSDDTALAMGSGTVEVLSTPRVLAWLEAACMTAIDDELDVGQTTVGMRTQLDHLHPTVVGARVSCRAELERVEGRRLTFVVRAADDADDLAVGHLTRVIVETDRFVAGASNQDGPGGTRKD